jgi:histidyl-tRNA synthetase
MMASKDKTNRPKARVAKGFRDVDAQEIRGVREMLATIQKVYELYGFEPVEQPFIEYTDALGKFLPDLDRPNEGVFSFQDDDDQWLSLRYDLTAPLARYVAENQQFLPTPFRSYRQGWVFRNEKPGPGRYRQFMQFDADTVGSASPAADAEVCMMAADTMEALGIKRGQYVVKVNNRKILDGCLENIGLDTETDSQRRLLVLRAMDKLDRLGVESIKLLLGKGRKDESGDFTVGANLESDQIDQVVGLFANSVSAGVRLTAENGVRVTTAPGALIEVNLNHEEISQTATRIVEPIVNKNTLEYIRTFIGKSSRFSEGLNELDQMVELFDKAGYSTDRIVVDPSVVRGLEYYTGPVFECELLMDARDEKGTTVRFGSVGGGGRYDGLVSRFISQPVPATGFSIGVSRLYSALKLLGQTQKSETLAPVVVLVMDKDRQGDYQKMVQQLRGAGIRAEMYVGNGKIPAQMKYADKRGSPLVVIQGGDEKAKGEVMLKDLRLGAELARSIETREQYASQRLAQVSVPEADLVAEVRKMLERK